MCTLALEYALENIDISVINSTTDLKTWKENCYPALKHFFWTYVCKISYNVINEHNIMSDRRSSL